MLQCVHESKPLSKYKQHVSLHGFSSSSPCLQSFTPFLSQPIGMQDPSWHWKLKEGHTTRIRIYMSTKDDLKPSLVYYKHVHCIWYVLPWSIVLHPNSSVMSEQSIFWSQTYSTERHLPPSHVRSSGQQPRKCHVFNFKTMWLNYYCQYSCSCYVKNWLNKKQWTFCATFADLYCSFLCYQSCSLHPHTLNSLCQCATQDARSHQHTDKLDGWEGRCHLGKDSETMGNLYEYIKKIPSYGKLISHTNSKVKGYVSLSR